MQETSIDQGIGIKKKTFDSTISVLNQVLADEHVLLMKLRNFNWNVSGPNFRELHALFDEQKVIVARWTDEVAERIRALGAPATATMIEYLHRTAIREHPGSFPPANEMLHDLLANHETVIRYIRNVLTAPTEYDLDVGTIDLFTDVIQDHEKMAWVIRATLSRTLDDHQERYSVLYE
jgi:starvation-inducible DNA-binding protein